MANTHVFTKEEEWSNSITHGFGVLLSIAALVLLIVFSSLGGTAWHIVSFTIFGVTMILLYTSSTFVHALRPGRAKDFFEIMDHSSIYFFIAGTYTPFMLIAVKGWIGWTLFGIVWGLAIAGTVFKSFFVKKFLFTSTILYIIMGWLIVFAWNDLVSNLHPTGLLLLEIGGIMYTVGAIFYMWRLFKHHHAFWHLFVLGGTICHFFSVLYLLP
ncbi:hemolysin III family protein [Mesobacillus foraminis]|uniref:PAQR family membrane homeostasis protein TrhA n=1 Tax=Mesobacillus foraminis TaxID=279826 RepID=UPI001BEB1AC2|nr:hemolysin III family protein [Mesobacillus foraminis]MBT2756974.1 hemolysin III family protein [Mesobacillus foraminis]